MMRLFRKFLWALIRITDPRRHLRPKGPPPAARPLGPPPTQRTIALPPGVPRHRTVKMPPLPVMDLSKEDYPPGTFPPEVRRS